MCYINCKKSISEQNGPQKYITHLLVLQFYKIKSVFIQLKNNA